MPSAPKRMSQVERPVKPAAHRPEERVPQQAARESTPERQTDAHRIVAQAIWKLNVHDARRMREFLEVLQANDSNSVTPIEDFIADLPRWWKYGRERGEALTPDSIIEMINAPGDGCRAWFDDAVAIARDFNRYYKEVLDKADAEAMREEDPAE